MEEILLGIDYGEKHTGLAFGRHGLASPLHVIEGSDPNVVKAEGNLIFYSVFSE